MVWKIVVSNGGRHLELAATSRCRADSSGPARRDACSGELPNVQVALLVAYHQLFLASSFSAVHAGMQSQGFAGASRVGLLASGWSAVGVRSVFRACLLGLFQSKLVAGLVDLTGVVRTGRSCVCPMVASLRIQILSSHAAPSGNCVRITGRRSLDRERSRSVRCQLPEGVARGSRGTRRWPLTSVVARGFLNINGVDVRFDLFGELGCVR